MSPIEEARVAGMEIKSWEKAEKVRNLSCEILDSLGIPKDFRVQKIVLTLDCCDPFMYVYLKAQEFEKSAEIITDHIKSFCVKEVTVSDDCSVVVTPHEV